MINMHDVEEIVKPLVVLIVAAFGVYIVLPSKLQDDFDRAINNWFKRRRLRKNGRDVHQIVTAARNRKV